MMTGRDTLILFQLKNILFQSEPSEDEYGSSDDKEDWKYEKRFRRGFLPECRSCHSNNIDTKGEERDTEELIALARKRDLQLIDTRIAFANEMQAKNAALALANRLQKRMNELKALYIQSQGGLENESFKVTMHVCLFPY